jgi:hypothetical protein
VTTVKARTRAAVLLGELEATLPHLDTGAQLEVRAGVVRIGETILARALGAAASQREASEQEYGLATAAGVLGRSERWLRAHRAELRIGYQLNGAGPWRFTRRELERVQEMAKRRRR